MKVVILAGGIGTRLSEETTKIPKPLVNIGNMPIIWHIMKYYYYYRFNDFVICAGYKQHLFKEYFANYAINNGDIFLCKNKIINYGINKIENWKIVISDTGENTGTGGRLKRIKKYIENDYKNCDNFFMTYGDGLSNVDLNKLLEFHKSHGKLATLTSIEPKGKYGVLDIEKDRVKSFNEKPRSKRRINGGFMILNKKVLDYIKDNSTMFEQEPLQKLAKDNQLMAYHHDGFWKAMDILKEKEELNDMWVNNKAPWRIW